VKTISKKSPFRQTTAVERDRGEMRPVLVAQEPSAVVLRLKGTRTEYRLTWSKLYQLAAQAQAEQDRSQRRFRRSIPRGVLC
jgi:hypothetical protein